MCCGWAASAWRTQRAVWWCVQYPLHTTAAFEMAARSLAWEKALAPISCVEEGAVLHARSEVVAP